MKLKHLIYILITLLYLFNVNAVNTKMFDPDKVWQISKLDGIESDIKFNVKYLGNNVYKFDYYQNNQTLFDTINNCLISYNGSRCYYYLQSKNNSFSKESIKDKDLPTKTVIEAKVAKLFLEKLPKYKLEDLAIDSIEIANTKSLTEIVRGNITVTGDYNPIKFKKGTFNVTVLNGLMYSNGQKLKLGLKSLIITFNNSLSSEALILGNYYGINFNYTRYLAIEKYMNLSTSFITLSGVSNYKGVYRKGDQENNYTYFYITRATSKSTQWLDFHVLNKLINFSVDISYDAYVSCWGQSASAIVGLKLSDGVINRYLENDSVTDGGGGCYTSDTGSYKYKLVYNTTDGYLYYFNLNTNAYIKKKSLSAWGNTLYLYFATSGSAGDFGQYGDQCYMKVYTYGFSNNKTLYKSFIAPSTGFPNRTKLYIGKNISYRNNTLFNGTKRINITRDVKNSYNNSLCNCLGCESNIDYCMIPFKFFTSDGGQITYSNINITATYPAGVVNISFYNKTSLNKTNAWITYFINNVGYGRYYTNVKNIVFKGYNYDADMYNSIAFNNFNMTKGITQKYIFKNNYSVNLSVNLQLLQKADVKVKFRVTDRAYNTIQPAPVITISKMADNSTVLNNYKVIDRISPLDTGWTDYIYFDSNSKYLIEFEHDYYVRDSITYIPTVSDANEEFTMKRVYYWGYFDFNTSNIPVKYNFDIQNCNNYSNTLTGDFLTYGNTDIINNIDKFYYNTLYGIAQGYTNKGFGTRTEWSFKNKPIQLIYTFSLNKNVHYKDGNETTLVIFYNNSVIKTVSLPCFVPLEESYLQPDENDEMYDSTFFMIIGFIGILILTMGVRQLSDESGIGGKYSFWTFIAGTFLLIYITNLYLALILTVIFGIIKFLHWVIRE